MMPTSVEAVGNLNYSELVGLLGERNRPSGGIRTVHSVAVNAFVGPGTRMLEIGSNTGFTCVNMALLTGCKCVGIDVTEASIIEAKKYAKDCGIEDNVEFVSADALSIPFADKSFDIVWCSNVTSFIQDKHTAISEYLRVLKEGGTLVVAPIYYRKEPPETLLDRVSEAVGTRVEAWSKKYWLDLFDEVTANKGDNLVKYYEKDFSYEDRENVVGEYVADIVSTSSNFEKLDLEVGKAVSERYGGFIKLFNENLRFAGFSILLFQKRRIPEQTELFITLES